MTTTRHKRMITFAALLLGLIGVQTAEAAKTAKAIEYSDERMVYYYDDADHSSDAYFVKQWAVRSASASAAKSPTRRITTIVIDSSFASWSYGYMEGYFWGLSDATTIQGLEYLNTSSATTIANMFRGCSKLTTLDLSHLNTAKVTTMTSLFTGCSSLTSVDLSSFSSAKLENVSYMFQNCSALETIYATSQFVLTGLAKTAGAFASCSKLAGDRGSSYDSSHTDGSYGRLDGGTDAPGYFSRPRCTLTIDAGEFSTKHIQSVSVLTNSAPVEPSNGTTYSIEKGVPATIVYTPTSGYWFDGVATYTDDRYATAGLTADATLSGDDIPTAVLIPADLTLTVDKTAFADNNVSAVVVTKTLDGSVVEPTSVTAAANTYTITSGIGFTLTYQATDGNYFLVQEVQNKGKILDSFSANSTYAETGIAADTTVTTCPSAAETVYGTTIRAVVTPSEPETLTFYFDAAASVGTIYLRNAASGYPTWNGLTTVRRVVINPSMAAYGQNGDGFQYLFYGLSNVTNIEGIANLNPSAATSFYQTFKDCASLTGLDLSSWTSANVTAMGDMFYGCSSLTTLDISAFSSDQVTGCGNMFRGCSSLTTIYTKSDFDLKDANGAWMFWGSSKLVGGNGTKYSSSYYLPAYAHVDTDGNPGYFTLKYNTLTIDASAFAAKHIASVSVTVSGETIEPTTVGGSVYLIPAGEGFVITYTAEDGYLLGGEKTYAENTYATSGIYANVSLEGEALPTGVDESVLSQTYSIRYYDGKDNHISLRDTRYPYSLKNAFALYDASSMAPVPTSSSYGKFIGWCENADRSDEPKMELPALTVGDKVLYAAYEYGKTDWLLSQAKTLSEEKSWTGPVIAHASSDKVTAGESYTVTMPYRLHTPATFESGKKYPLILHLHGAGSRGNDNSTQMGAGIKQTLDYMRRQGVEAITISPQIPYASMPFGPEGYTAYDFVSEQMREIAPGNNNQAYGPTWVDTQWDAKTSHTMAAVPTVWFQAATNILFETIRNAAYQVDPDRIYVLGMSMGGYGTWEMLARFPTTFAAAIPCCGGADPTTFTSAHREVSVWAFHGANDTTVWPVRTEEAIAALRNVGGTPRLTEYGDNYGLNEGISKTHNCWSTAFSDDNVMDWLFEQTRGASVPTAVWTGNGANNDWLTKENWSDARVPQAGDDVILDAAATLTLTNATPRFKSVTIGANFATTLAFSGPDAALWADETTIGANATLTCADSSSRVCLKGYAVTVAAGGAIDADAAGATTAGRTATGGAIAFELTGPLTVSGSISAKGGAADAADGLHAGAGGTIVAEVGEIVAAGGTIAAEGGNATEPYAESTTGRIGAGGAITLRYQTHIQKEFTPNKTFDLTVSAEHGTYRWLENDEEKTLACVDLDKYGTGADLGTIWFADNKFMGGFGRGLNGQLLNITDYTNIAGQGYNFFKSGHARLVGSAALKILGLNVRSGARLELGDGGETAPSFNMYWKNNSMAVQSGARLDLYAPRTATMTIGTTGTVFTVNGTLRLWAHPETGNSPKIVAKSLIANAESVISATTALDIWAKTFDLKSGSTIAVSGEEPTIVFSSGKIYEEGDRIFQSASPTDRWAGSSFNGTITGATPTYQMIRPPVEGCLFFIR